MMTRKATTIPLALMLMVAPVLAQAYGTAGQSGAVQIRTDMPRCTFQIADCPELTPEIFTDGGDYVVTNQMADGGDYVVTNAQGRTS